MTLKWPWPWKFVWQCIRLIESFKKVLGFIFLWLTVCKLRRKNGKCPQGILEWPWPWNHSYQKMRLIEFFQIVAGFIALSPTAWELLRKNRKMPSGHLGMTLTLKPYLPKDAFLCVLSNCHRFHCSITNGLGVIKEKPEKWPFMPSGDGLMTFHAKSFTTIRCASLSTFIFISVLCIYLP